MLIFLATQDMVDFYTRYELNRSFRNAFLIIFRHKAPSTITVFPAVIPVFPFIGP